MRYGVSQVVEGHVAGLRVVCFEKRRILIARGLGFRSVAIFLMKT